MSSDLDTRPAAPAPVDVLTFLGLDPRDVKAQALVALATRYGLDPLAGHLVMVDRRPFITRDGLLHVAHRSGQLDGIVITAPPAVVDGEWRCTVSVFRKDMSHPFTFPGRYPTRGGNQKYAPEMALKVAESMALRRAFDVTGIASVDEMHDGVAVRDDDALSGTVERTAGRPAPTSWDTVVESPTSASGGLHGHARPDGGEVGAPGPVEGGAPTGPRPEVDELDVGARFADRVGPVPTADPRRRTTPGGQPYGDAPTQKQMGAWNARLRAVGCRDSIHRGWATAVLLDRVTFVASLTDLSRQDLSALLDLAPAVLEQALVVTVDLGHPDDDLDTTDPGPVPEPPEYTVEDPGTWPHDADELKG